MIVTWLADVTALQEESIYRKKYEQVPLFRRDKADKCRMQEDKVLSVGAWILYERMLKEYGLQGNEMFNLSHSGNFALCSIAIGEQVQVGCDLEQIRLAMPQCMKMAKRFFCESEYEKIRSIEDFYRFWVLKESFMKATRMGSKLAMNKCEFAFGTDGSVYLQKQPFEQDYYFVEYTVENLPYKIAVCSDVDTFAPEIKCVKL